MDFQETLERMKNGRLYYCSGEELMALQTQYLERLHAFNQTRPSEGEKRAAMLREMFAEIGEGCYIEPPLHANWGGKNVHFGNNVYANFNLTLVDDGEVYVGDNVMFAPNVTVATASHPVHPVLRSKQAQYNLPVFIENNVWIGAGAVILPGVRIGENSVIGAGSVVTKDIPKNVVAVGNPCRVLREIGERDFAYYHRDWKIDLE
ncbi:MAG TPA: sugar O-acetyltransferase [Firmicutes bacterium]|nr:sugar O-acetyltransferase [Bacillota bacterium]